MIESLCKVSADTNTGKELEPPAKRPANVRNRESILERYSDFSVNIDSLSKFIADIEFPAGSAPSLSGSRDVMKYNSPKS